jgi:hypothetical protein
MKTYTVTSLVLAAFTFFAPLDDVQAATITGLFNTGVDGTGTVLPNGTADPHYSLTGPLSGAVVTARFIDGANQWVVPPAGSAWIGPLPSSQSAPTGHYVYTLRFDLTGFDPATAIITGDLAADNTPLIFLNGTDTGFSHPNQYVTLESFAITNGFLPGTNFLEFRVSNNPSGGQNPTGLLIANLSGTVQDCPRSSIRTSEVEICWPSRSNAVYRVDYRSELTTNSWIPLFTNIVGNGETLCVYDKITVGQPYRFYRVNCPTE